MAENPVACKDCGLLMFRDELTGEARSADERARRKGNYVSGQKAHTITHWLCRGSSPAFIADAPNETNESAVKIISFGIKCDKFVQLQPAKDAKEHEEMTLLEAVKRENRQARDDDRQWMEEWRTKEQADVERRHQEQLAWRKEVENYAREQQAAAEKITNDRRDEDRAATRNMFWATLGVSLLAAIISIVALYAGK